MKKKSKGRWSRPPRKKPASPPRRPASPLERVIAARVMTLKDADPDLFFKTLRALKCELAVELLKITDMEDALKAHLADREPDKTPAPPPTPLALYAACTEAIVEGDDEAFDRAAYRYLTDKKSRK